MSPNNRAGRARPEIPAVHSNQPLFSLGTIVATPAVLEHLDHYGIDAHAYVERHRYGDWGSVPPEEAAQNTLAVKSGLRVFSSYSVAGKKIWVITEADRSATTLFFVDEY